MIRKRIVLFVLLAMACLLTGMGERPGEAPRMTVEELNGKLGTPDLVILDVRAASDWDGSDRKIAGAIRENPKTLDEWAGKYQQGKTLVLYCA